MKFNMKVFKILFLISVFSSASAESVQYSPYYYNCIDSSDSLGVNGYGVICYEMEISIQKARLNRAYLHYINQIDISSKKGKSFVREQKSWLLERDKKCKSNLNDARHNAIDSLTCQLDQNRQRAEYIESLF